MSQTILELLAKSALETIYMVFAAGGVGTLFCLPLGIVLATTGTARSVSPAVLKPGTHVLTKGESL